MELQNLKPITEHEKKELLIVMLKELITFFEDNDIRYYIAFGSLLGAIRHKGFIPWDDDIDIIVPRCSYIRLLKLVKENVEFFGSKNIEIISYNADHNAYYKRFKFADTRTVMEEFGESRSAVFIDIFPLEFFKSSKKLKLQGKLCHYYANLLDLCTSNEASGSGIKKVLYKCLLIIHRIIGLDRATRFYEKKFLNFAKFKKQGIACASQSWNLNICFTDASLWTETVKMEFEGISVNAPIGWDSILTKNYGDYMVPPPPEKRFAHDNYKMYWRDKNDSLN